MSFPAFQKYEELAPELKLEIWRQASLSPGVHHFKVRPWIGTRGADLNVQRVDITPAGQADSDPSVWRARIRIAKADKYSWDVVKKLLKGASTKEIWRPQRGNYSGAVIDCDHDLVCVRFHGLISNPYIGNFGDFDKLAGIRRVAVEYRKNWRPSIMYNWPQPIFQCLCHNTTHDITAVCPKAFEDFIPYFPDIDVFYFMVKLTSQTIIPPPPVPKGKKRSRQGVIKEDDQQPEPAPAESPTRGKVAQVTSETFTKFRDIAERNKLDTFEDRVYTYCEAREADTSCLLMHEEIWKVFSELKGLWKLAKTKLPPPYPVREPELKVLVYTELKKR